jgi:hypothetical protein
MKMTESIKFGIQEAGIVLLSIGLILFLSETHHAGEALESFRISLSLNAISITGAGLVILSTMIFLLCVIWKKQK